MVAMVTASTLPSSHSVPQVIEPTPPEPPAKPRDPRLPPVGTVIHRAHKGEVHEITVLEDGFEYGGAHYRSLSRIAKVVTGTSWNGFLWMNSKARLKRFAFMHGLPRNKS